MNLLQSIRRIQQQFENDDSWVIPSMHIKILTKLYAKNGLKLVNTCMACPEQYEAFKDEKQVAYLRLRHGEFTVRYPDHLGDRIYTAEPIGDGIFENEERFKYMIKAMEAIKIKYHNI